MLIATGGLVASGKSSMAREIARALDAVHIEADAVRDEVLHIEPCQAAHEAAWQNNLAPGVTDRIYSEMFDRARRVLAAGRSTVVDGCFARREQREAARETARGCGTRFLFVECRTPRPVLEQRLRARSIRAGVPAEAWLSLLDRIEGRWEPVSELAEAEHLPVDSTRPVPGLVDAVIEHLGRSHEFAATGGGA